MDQKNTKKIHKTKIKEIDEKLYNMQQEYLKVKNPYQLQAERALKLKVHDFSVDDKTKAEKIMKEYKLKIQLKQTMS